MSPAVVKENNIICKINKEYVLISYKIYCNHINSES